MIRLSTTGLVAAACSAHVLTMLGFSSFATLLPQFQASWGLSNTEAGWINAIFFAGYVAAVPVLVSLTDRVPARTIYLFSALLTAVASFGFALLAQGFWSALLLRAAAGVAIAGSYMPGLKALTDAVPASAQSRALSFYVASFSGGAALSYALTGVLADWAGWPLAFSVSGGAALIAAAIAALVFSGAAPDPDSRPPTRLLDFRPVIRNRATLAYSLCYAYHNWELFGFRSWVVALLVYAETLYGPARGALAPAMLAGIVTILAVPSSIVGNEIAIRVGRRTAVAAIMALSAGLCFVIGFSSGIAYGVVAGLCVLHGITTIGESAAVTAGAVGHAPANYRGATMAFHTMIGFAGACLGPLAFGVILDLAGSGSVAGWGLAFAHMGAVMLLGPLTLALLRPPPLAGDRL